MQNSDVPFGVGVVHSNGSLVIRVAGELDVGTAPLLAARLQDLASSHLRALVLDLAGLRFVDVAGLRALLDASWDALALGATFRLLDPPAFAVNTMRLAAFHPLLEAIDYSPA